jgi:hypothetical protein
VSLAPLAAGAQTYYYVEPYPGEAASISATNATCDATEYGAIRYNTGNSSFEGCNGAAWGPLASSSATTLNGIVAATGDGTAQNSAAHPILWYWNTLTTTNGLTLGSTSLTSGNILFVSSSNAGANTGAVVNVANATTGVGYGVKSTMSGAAANGYAVYGTVTDTGNNGYAVYGQNLTTTTGFGVYGHLTGNGNTGTAVTGMNNPGTNTALNYGVYGETSTTAAGYGVKGVESGGSGNGYGVFGTSNSTGVGIGVGASETGTNNTGAAFYGVNTPGGGATTVNYGVYGETNSTAAAFGVKGVESGGTGGGYGVYGTSNSITGGNGVGGFETGANNTGEGVYGANSSTNAAAAGVQGQMTATNNQGYSGYFNNNPAGGANTVNYGAAGMTNSTGAAYGIYGQETGTTNLGYAVYGINNGATNTGINWGGYFETTSIGAAFGVEGKASGGTNTGIGVYGLNSSNGVAYGVRGDNTTSGNTGAGVLGTNVTTGANFGVEGSNTSVTAGAAGVYGQMTGTNNTGYAVYGANTGTTNTGFGGYFTNTGGGIALGVNGPYTIPVPNAGGAGTTLYKLAKLNGTGQAIIAAGTDTSGIIGIVQGGAGTSGNAQISYGGAATCVFDGATTAGDYVQISATAGDCHDTSSATLPASNEIIGRTTQTIGSTGNATLLVGLQQAVGGAGASTLNGITAATGNQAGISNGNNTIVWNWALTSAGAQAFTFGESAASTSTGTPSIVQISTLAASTATPLTITNAGASTIAENITAGGIAFAGTNVMAYPHAGADTTGLAVGPNSLTSETTGTANVAIGVNAGQYISAGASNTAVGNLAMTGVSGTPLTGNFNTAVGDSALTTIQGAATNDTAVGRGALKWNSTASFNTAVGAGALFGLLAAPLTGSSNTAVGNSALGIAQGGSNDNTALGGSAGAAVTTGTDNTLLGWRAGYGVTGNLNIIVGEDSSSAITTGSSNILVGNGLSGVTNTSSNQLDIGDLIIGNTSSKIVGINDTTLLAGYDLGFSGQAARTIGMERETTATIPGFNLTIGAGGAVSGGTNLAGGNMVITSGVSTGNASSNIIFQTSGGGAGGVSDRALAEVARFNGNGRLGLLGDNNPTADVELHGNVGRIIGMDRGFAAAGQQLTLSAGSPTAGGSNKLGGNLVLTGGISTGTGISNVILQVSPGIAAATTDNTLIEIARFTPTGLQLDGTTSGSVTLTAGATPAAQTYTLPNGYPPSPTGYVLQSSNAGVMSWVAGGGTTLNGITAATANQTGIDSGAYTIEWDWNALNSGSALKLASTSTAAASNTQTMLNIALSGVSASPGQTTYGEQISNTHGGAGTNVGLSASASGGSSNYAALFAAGNVGVGTAAPIAGLDVQNGITAASGVAYGMRQQQTLTAAANNDTLYGLYLNTTYTNGAFTGVSNFDLGINGTGSTPTTTPRMIMVDRNATAAKAGYNLQIGAGGSTVGGTDLNGGTLILSSGIATGLGSSNISLRVAQGTVTGTSDHALVEIMKLSGGGNFTGYNVQWGANSASASGGAATAWGQSTSASGYSSTAWGQYSQAGGQYSTAFGGANGAGGAAYGDSSMVFGNAQTGTSPSTGGIASIAIGATSTACAVGSTCPKVTGTGSVGIFMGNHTTNPVTTFSPNSTFGILGGKFYINPGTSLGTVNAASVRAGFDAGNITDAIVLPTGSVAQRPTATNGMLRYNSDNNVLEYVGSGTWTTIGAAGVTTPAGSNTQIQYNNSGALGASSNLTWTTGTTTLTVNGSVSATNNVNVAKYVVLSPQAALAAPTPLKLATLGDTSVSAPSNGQCLTYSTGSAAWINGSCASGSGAVLTVTKQIFTTTTLGTAYTTTYTPHAGLLYATVEVVGPGGGGGAVNLGAAAKVDCGGGGGAGGYVRATLTGSLISSAAPITITVAAGGLGGAAGAHSGAASVTPSSSFVGTGINLVATSGSGGTFIAPANLIIAAGGVGGVGSGGDVNSNGGAGGTCMGIETTVPAYSTVSGAGGNSFLGNGGVAVGENAAVTTSAGTGAGNASGTAAASATGYGGGGSGAAAVTTGAAAAGGNGGDGIVIVTEYNSM